MDSSKKVRSGLAKLEIVAPRLSSTCPQYDDDGRGCTMGRPLGGSRDLVSQSFFNKWVGGERDLAYGQVKEMRGLAAPERDGES